MLFVDASALVKRYVRERHSVTVRRLVAAGPVAVSRLSEVEVPSAIHRLVRERRLSVQSRDRAIAACLMDFAAWHVIEITGDVTALARTLLHRHDLRAGDAIQLASAVWLRQAVSVSGVLAFDTRLVTAAHAEQFAAPVLPRTKRAGARASRRSSAKEP
jgi:predicted nucleic acid-binding protein